MPPKIESLNELLLMAAGGILIWLGGILKKWVTSSTEKRRQKVDEIASLELALQEHREVIYQMRTEMLRSGHFTRDELPAMPRRRPKPDSHS